VLTLDPAATQLGVGAMMVVLGIGLGPAIPLFTLAIQNSVVPQQIGVATAAATFSRSMGMTVGLAVVGTVFATSLATMLPVRMGEVMRELPPAMQQRFAHGPDQGAERGGAMFNAPAIKAAIDADIDRTSKLPAAQIAEIKTQAHAAVDKVEAAFKRAFTDALLRVFMVSLAIALLAMAITLFLPALPLRKAPIGARPPPSE
jgi:hypothetical protein